MDRNALLLKGVTREKTRILEIGPSFSPIAPKRDGWRTTILDHTDREGLVTKYRGVPDVDVSRIEEVDYVWTGGPLDVLLRESIGQFDVLIASHVIEHIVDPIGFLNSASRLLSPDGRIVLAVPDKRLCFDCLRPVSTVGEVIAAARSGRRLHSVAAVFDALSYDARPDGGIPSWARDTRVTPQMAVSLESSRGLLDTYDAEGNEYVDVHGWVFTPASFEYIVIELSRLELISWRISRIVQRPATEFLVFMERGTALLPEDLLERRRQLLVRQIEEIREQSEWMEGASADLTNLLGSLRREVANVLPPSLRGWRRLFDPTMRSLGEQYRMVAACPLFDARWYLEHNPDVKASGMDPVEHYLRHGAAEGRDPGPYFGTAGYVAAHPEGNFIECNPLAHYLGRR